jgi:hypothetical protein
MPTAIDRPSPAMWRELTLLKLPLAFSLGTRLAGIPGGPSPGQQEGVFTYRFWASV